ncbi:uncharacterized protein LOC100186419 [Ciona intestinalis]
MIFDMDAELQHLINISMDKMTSGAGSSLAGHGSRKSRGMDLRKALLVAHVLQKVRCAYIDDDYQIVANTISDPTPVKYLNEDETLSDYDTVKEFDERCKQASYYLSDDDVSSVPQPSPTVLQSCMTNSDVMVSRIAQVTRPMSVSINTSHVVSYQSLDVIGTEGESDDVICEELDVSSCCEVSSYEEETQPRESEIDMSLTAVNVGCKTHEVQDTIPAVTSSKPSCPLPRKKRPLPKEFLDTAPSPFVTKSPRTNCYDVTTTTTSFTPTTSATVGLESRTSVSVTTVSSTIGASNSLCTSVTSQNPLLTSTVSQRPKVVVQMTQACGTYLPITSTRLYFNTKLAEVSLQQSAMV